jgi:predicted acylesterase/phospholipase RssA
VRGFAASGGGSKGQWHVGVIERLMGDLETNYDAYAGVSVGALVVAFLGQFSSGQEKEAADELVDLFSGIRNKNIWKRWFPFGKLSLWKSSALNSSPIAALVRGKLDVGKILSSGKKVRVGAVALDTMEYRIFSEDFREFSSAVLASASYPAFFSPVQMAGHAWTDGGVRHVTPIKALIDLGCDEIDVSICHPPKARIPFEHKPNWPEVALRSIEIMSDQLIWADLSEAMHINRRIQLGDPEMGTRRQIKFRVFAPDQILKSDGLDFQPEDATRIQQLAYAMVTAQT